jgi:hypothetical protein
VGPGWLGQGAALYAASPLKAAAENTRRFHTRVYLEVKVRRLDSCADCGSGEQCGDFLEPIGK